MVSFRDPAGFVFQREGRVFRCVHPDAVETVQAFLDSPLAAEWSGDGRIPRTMRLDEESGRRVSADAAPGLPTGSVVFEHEAIEFPSYPYEWPPEMLRSAGALTLDLARAAMRAGFALKDATPYNVMFRGPQAVFLDISSLERRDPLESIWRPYAQFVRTFVYPLLACGRFGLRMDEILLPHRDGLEPERVAALCPAYKLLLPPFLSAVTLPALLDRTRGDARPGDYRARKAKDSDEATFLLERLFNRASGLLRSAIPRRRRSEAARYMETGRNYGPPEFAEKERILEWVFERLQPAKVLDIGCNTGHFSLMAARAGARVVALDRDPDSIDLLWRRAAEEQACILPLVVDITRPPGGCGWANRECQSFLDRARGRFDCVLMLALVHHLLVGERIPLAEVVELAAGLTTKLAVIEYVDPGDSQIARIARGRECLHRELTRENFEAAVRRRFRIVEARDASPTRRVYVLNKEGVESCRAGC